MPEVSVIIPVYNVEAYLEQCLDSILGQSFRDFELIAVDDCSPDGSADILRRYEREDARVRVVSLRENVGMGLARNAGLNVASGRYVWFIDSDDSIAPRSLETIVARARATDAEVVLFGWVRSFADGSSEPESGEAFLAAAPELFRAGQAPDVLRVLHVVWNKLIRRDLLDRIGVRFTTGLYEDTSFSLPVLVAATRITTLPGAFVNYRQRTASATKTLSERHLDVILHWDLALTLIEQIGIDSNGDAARKVRVVLFRRMLRHCLYVLLKSNRVPVHAHPEYFRRFRDLYRKHHPGPRYRAGGPGETMQHHIIKMGSLPLLRLYSRARGLQRSLGKRRSAGIKRSGEAAS